MPEGPELYLAAKLVNEQCCNRFFTGKVEKSKANWKNPEVDWNCGKYTIRAASRGKEVQLTLSEVGKPTKTLDIVFHFGMTGCFKLQPRADLHKHAHLNFFSSDKPAMVLSFVDVRRFGKWVVGGSWSDDRGPCVLQHYTAFRNNVLENLESSVFSKPICETLLNQKYFNGIGNYLRAEILYRAKIPPFTMARSVLENCKFKSSETPDLLQLCHLLPKEVINLDGKGYEVEGAGVGTAFGDWLQCYFQPGMSSKPDSNKRTIWFHGVVGGASNKSSSSKITKKRSVKNHEIKTESPNTPRLADKKGTTLKLEGKTKVKSGKDIQPKSSVRRSQRLKDK